MQPMNTGLSQALEQLSPAEKMALGEALVVSAASAASAPLISTAQRSELSERLAYHRAHPEEAGLGLAPLMAQLRATKH